MEVRKDSGHLTKVVIQLRRECHEWAGIRTKAKVQELIHMSQKLRTQYTQCILQLYTNGSVNRESSRCGWVFVA